MKMSCIDRLEGGEKNLGKSVLKGEAEGRREAFPAQGQPLQKS